MNAKNINQIASLHFAYKSLYVQKNKTIIFLTCRKLLLIFNTKFSILNFVLSFRFLLQKMVSSFFYIELFQTFIHFELINILLKTHTSYSLSKPLSIIKKEYLTVSIKELSINIFFDNIKMCIRHQKILYKLFKIYKSAVIASFYSSFFKKLFLVVNNVYKIITKLHLTRQYLYKNILHMYIKDFSLVVILSCKSLYTKNAINGLLYVLRVILKRLTIRYNYLSIYVKNNSYNGNYVNYFFSFLQLTMYRKKLVSRFLCLGYSKKNNLYPNCKQYFLLKQVPSLIKFKLLLNSLVFYYKRSVNKKFIFIKIISFLKSVFHNRFSKKIEILF